MQKNTIFTVYFELLLEYLPMLSVTGRERMARQYSWYPTDRWDGGFGNGNAKSGDKHINEGAKKKGQTCGTTEKELI